ncbi:Diacylglycerol acyltransferase family protein [Cryptosporidium meleagridis]|uniref:Acyltransferase n=1 Tax=Cryptosporidium meleagridis TaxID=93969 RepID=A0A2P4Z683_9CRYT|nr:Diacylglycerol acyltransferase family protein [Cryptosporidium meleagridis]
MENEINEILIKESDFKTKIIDIPVDFQQGGIRPILGCISYTILILTWGISILIPVGIVYWFFLGNWNMIILLLTIILVPIIFNWHDNVPGFIKYLSNLLTRDVHHWTGPGKIIIEDPDFEINSKQLLCLHPHGILGIGSMYIIISGIFSKLHLIVTESLVWLQPIISVILNSTVKLRGASHFSFKQTMKREEGPLVMFPGGFHETILLNWGKDAVFIERRFGFIKYCLKYNYLIRPVYVFGECLSFHQFQHFKRFRWILNDFSLPSVIFCGETWWNPLLPLRNVPYLIVIGKPINSDIINSSCNSKLKNNNNPSREMVKKYHNLYIQNLKRIYTQYSPFYQSFFSDHPLLERYIQNKSKELTIE